MKPYLSPEQVNSLYPIIGANLYRGGLVLMRLNLSPFAGMRRKKGERGKISHLSRRSRSRLLLLVSTWKKSFRSLITLTYGQNYPLNGKGVKSDLNRFLTRLRQVYDGVGVVWFLEFQKRGAPHIHLLTTLPGPDDGERLWFAGMWSAIANRGCDWQYTSLETWGGKLVEGQALTTMGAVRWSHTRKKAWSDIRQTDGAARYASKYALKPYQKIVPEAYRDVGRFWGASRCFKLDDGEVVYGSEKQIREFLSLKGRNFDGWEVLPKIAVY